MAYFTAHQEPLHITSRRSHPNDKMLNRRRNGHRNEGITYNVAGTKHIQGGSLSRCLQTLRRSNIYLAILHSLNVCLLWLYAAIQTLPSNGSGEEPELHSVSVRYCRGS